jgi:hypothetical protein
MTSLATANDKDSAASEAVVRERFERWLAGIPSRPALHVRFVNTLSLLEHIGSVKIARTQSGPAITAEVLQHLAEETRHAQVLKKIAHGIDAAAVPDYSDRALLAGAAARGYFARLDVAVRAFVRRELPPALHNRAAYALVTWLVELRAAWLYPAYQKALRGGGLPFSVRSIIGEEERHLAEIEEGMERIGIARHEGLPALRACESELFARLARQLMAITDTER